MGGGEDVQFCLKLQQDPHPAPATSNLTHMKHRYPLGWWFLLSGYRQFKNRYKTTNRLYLRTTALFTGCYFVPVDQSPDDSYCPLVLLSLLGSNIDPSGASLLKAHL